MSNKKVAIKIYDKNKLKDPLKKLCLQREISILKGLNNENIVQLFEVIETGTHVLFNKIFMIFELLNGRSLKSLVRSTSSNSFTEEKCKQYLKPILKGLEYLHSKNISHRDIKMENIMMDLNGNPKLIDFGFAAQSKYNQKLKEVCGTTSYMPPEIVNRKEYDGAPVDMWSFGILMFVLVSGNFPFRGFSEKDLFLKIGKGTINYHNYFTLHLKQILKRLLESNPEIRATATEVI